MAEFKESREKEINSLFDDARKEIAKVDENANELKKNIVIKLAKKLEENIRLDTICIEIVIQLQGQVSGRFIRECLPEKYKQKHKIENAKKQKKQKQEENNNLAAVTPLDNKEVIIVDTDGRSSSFLQRDDEDSSKTESDDSIDNKTFTQSSSSSQQQIEQEHQTEYHDGNIDNKSKDPYYNEIKNQDLKQDDPLDKPITITDISNKEIVTEEEEEAITYKPSYDNDIDILPFEFSWPFRELRNYSAPLHSKIGDNGRVWFSGKINKNTGKVISQHFGRLNQLDQQPHQKHDDESIDSNSRDGADDL